MAQKMFLVLENLYCYSFFLLIIGCFRVFSCYLLAYFFPKSIVNLMLGAEG